MKILVLTGLYPDPKRPVHGIFIQRMLNAIAKCAHWEFTVVAPRPVPMPVLGGLVSPSLPFSQIPPVQVEVGDQKIYYPRYSHLPGLTVPGQSNAVARAAKPVCEEILKSGGYRAILGIYLYPYGVAAARLAKSFSLPLILSARGSDVQVLSRKFLLTKKIKRALGSARMIHAVSEEIGQEIEKSIGLHRGTVYVAGNGVNTDQFSPGLRPGCRRAIGVPDTATLILNVGRLAPVKNQADLIKSLVTLGKTVHLVLAGEGSEQEPLNQLAKKLDVADRVHFVGNKSPQDLKDLYREADLFVLSSLREGCPNALLEAVSSGIPCISTKVGATPTILADRRLGTLVTEEGERALTLAIVKTLGTSADLAAVEAFREKWSWPQVATDFAANTRRIMKWTR